jgi:hypothetical protein
MPGHRQLFVGLASLALAACDPGISLAFEKDFDQPVDPECIGNALRTVVPEVTRSTYVSEGGEGFPSGTDVIQFFYPDPSLVGGYNVDVAKLPSGKTHYYHRWGKLGTDLSPEEQAKILPLLIRANAAIGRICNRSFAGSTPKEVSG